MHSLVKLTAKQLGKEGVTRLSTEMCWGSKNDSWKGTRIPFLGPCVVDDIGLRGWVENNSVVFLNVSSGKGKPERDRVSESQRFGIHSTQRLGSTSCFVGGGGGGAAGAQEEISVGGLRQRSRAQSSHHRAQRTLATD